jgi:2-phosphosulfolactate phosphatase
MPVVETLLTPALFDLYSQQLEEKNIVIIDILRATTTICVAFENGVNSMVPVGSPEEAQVLQSQGMIAAAERNGETVAGFELGNSPQEYTADVVGGRNIAFTTTNGTRAMRLCSHAANVYIGSFLNIDALAKRLIEEGRDTILFCAGWKDKVNLEDTLFAGALADRIKHVFDAGGDAVMLARDLYEYASQDMIGYLQKASHVQRFKTLHVENDLDVCMQLNISTKIPVFENGVINLPLNESAHH